MSNELQVFQYEGNKETRVVMENGEPWICAKDVAEALGYSEASNPARLFQSVPDEWKGVKPIHTRSENGVEQGRDMLCLSEQGLYFFLGRSDKPAALPYQKWIAGEVVPSIRKTGEYVAPAVKKNKDEDLAWEKLSVAREREKRLRAKALLDGLKAFNDVMTPESKTVIMVKYNEMLTGCDMPQLLPVATEKWYSATELGKEFGMSKQKIGKIANENNLKAPEGQSNEFGTWVRSKSQNSSKEVMAWMYYEAGREWFRQHYAIN